MSNAPTPTNPPLSRRVQAQGMRIANVPMRMILGLPFSTPMSKRLMLARIVGRKTGRVYRQPLSYVREDADTLLTPGGGRWKLNLRPDQPVDLRIAGREVKAHPEVIGDPDEVHRLLGVIVAANPSSTRFMRIPTGADGRPDPSALRNIVGYGFRIVRWHLDPQP
jgi:F420H(2)-dependent quinone reductase